MGKRGKKAGADLAVVRSADVIAIPRPNPPSVLTAEQADVWVSVTNSLPADWFPVGTHGLLIQYCRHIVDANRIAQLLDAYVHDAVPVAIYSGMLKEQRAESRIIASLATRMRISQQATQDRERNKGKPKLPPWE